MVLRQNCTGKRCFDGNSDTGERRSVFHRRFVSLFPSQHNLHSVCFPVVHKIRKVGNHCSSLSTASEVFIERWILVPSGSLIR
ncbi:unnamed protein product, partial [Larinioides sclopetarius]